MPAILVAALAACPVAAQAQNATWNGPGVNWDDNANWIGGTVPLGTATFNGGTPVGVVVPGLSTIETIRFAGGTAYTIDILCGCGLVVSGSGVLNNSSATQTFNVDAGLLAFINSPTITGDVTINNINGGITMFGMPFIGSDTASAGSATIVNDDGATLFSAQTTAGNANIVNQGTVIGGGLEFAEQSNAGTATITNNNGGQTIFLDQSSAANSIITNNAGGLTIFGDPCGFCPHTATAANATIINQNGGGTKFYSYTTAGNSVINVLTGGYVEFYDNSTGGYARFVTDGDLNSTVDFSQTLGPNNDGVVTAGSIEGGGTFIIGNNTLLVGGNNLSTTITGAVDLCACGTFTKVGSGTLTFATGIDLTLFNGSLVVNGGTVVMDGDMSAALSATVNAGGTLAGGSIATPGLLPQTFINGGTLSPGNATSVIGRLGVSGDLEFAGGSTYAVDVAPTGSAGIPLATSADFTLATGPVALAGTVKATGLGGAGYTIGAIYPVLGTAAALNATRFDRLFVAGDFGSTRPVVTYDPADDTVYIELIQGSVSGQLTPGATQNQINVARGLDNALLGGVPSFAGFTNLYNLTGDDFLKALDQLSGEAATGFQSAAYQSMGSFLTTLLNPWSGARFGFGPAYSYADASSAEALDYAPRRKVARQAQQAMAAAMPVKGAVHEPRYSVWGAAYGGSNTIDADTVVGSHKTDVRGYGFAAGADFRVTPDALLGFALAGSRSSWGLSEGLGGGTSDNFHLGVYGSVRFGAAYVSAAVAYGAHWVDTRRSVVLPAAATLESDYDAHSFGGRIEAGYRILSGFDLAFTPYAALQATAVRAPGYLERATSGAGAFALQFDKAHDSAIRTELGSWVDRSFLIDGGSLTLRGRAAWAYDSGGDRALSAAFPALPGSGFQVTGATPEGSLALLSAAAEWRYLNGFSFQARVDTELSDRVQALSGTGTIRYVW